MAFLIHLSPVLLVMSMLMVLRRPPVQAAMAGAGLVAVLWLMDGFMASAALAAFKDTAVLFASTALVIVPGLAFVILIERRGVNQALAEWVQALGLKRAERVMFIVLGLAPLLEAMTGFGVSLIATVPLLLSLFERRIALRVALTGMAIMPWGTLGLATVIGASLAHVEASTLAATSALTSAPVFIALAALASYLCGVGITRVLVGLGLLFLAVLYGLSRWLGPEVAGVGAGLSVAAATLLLALYRRRGATALAWPRSAWPYLALIMCIVLLKALNALTHLEDAWVVRGTHVAWKPLASPGIALLLVLLWVRRGGGDGLLGALAVRARRPLLTILLFLAMSQMMLKAGFLDGLVQVLSGLPDMAVVPLVALLGGLSGYMTGSNVGGNAIFMPAVALLPEASRWLLAALQNSAAGHAALGSLSIVMLVLGLARTSPEEEGQLVRFGFGLACLNTALVALAGGVLLALQ
ncbi:L-lactate permease [Pseudomonas poae]|nr:L-lactate permease [Pseudomonas poae]